MDTTTATGPATATEQAQLTVELALGGMTCASCAAPRALAGHRIAASAQEIRHAACGCLSCRCVVSARAHEGDGGCAPVGLTPAARLPALGALPTPA